MGFGLPDSSARALAGADSSVDALARVIELPLVRPETISPELALVDPELARLARARLHEPGSFWPGGADRRPAPAPPPLRTVVPAPAVAAWGTPLRTAPAPAVSVAAAELLAERTAVSRADRFFQPAPPRPLVPGGMAAVAAALLVGVGGGLAWVLPEPTSSPVSSSADTPPVVAPTPGRVSADPPSVTPTSRPPAAPATQEPRTVGEPAAKDPPKTPTKTQPKAQPAAPKAIPVLPPAPSPPPTAAPAAKTAEARTFAWAPAPGATGYEVQLFRGNDRVLVERTEQTRLKIGPKWAYEGRPMTLEPGRYRWYVWPLGAGGTRSDTPVVQARVLIGAG
jgi:hypothetical protein